MTHTLCIKMIIKIIIYMYNDYVYAKVNKLNTFVFIMVPILNFFFFCKSNIFFQLAQENMRRKCHLKLKSLTLFSWEITTIYS